MTPLSRRLTRLCALTYLLSVAILAALVLVETHGHFTYPLDDPYIHLALAEHLAQGHYGINAVEFSSPSSSILWPFLLIPFAGTWFHVYVPLVWNLIFGFTAACLIGTAVANWPEREGHNRLSRNQLSLCAVLLLFAASLPALTLLGMEHVLQVLLAIACSMGMIEALAGRRIPSWCLAAAVVAPMVRYEDLTLSLAIAIALGGLRQYKTAVTVFLLSLLPLLSFSLFLHRMGLPLLPMSVLVKGSVYSESSVHAGILSLLRTNLHSDVREPEHFPILLLFFIFAGLTWKAATRERRFVFAGATTLAALQLLIGRFGWFHRYEVYASIFLVLLVLHVFAERPRPSFPFVALGILFCSAPYLLATALTPAAALEVYQQQYQTRRFLVDYYKGDFAVNDIGLPSFQRRPGSYILDVEGLASPEAGREATKSAQWLEAIVRRHHVELAILYPDWFHIPASWVPLGSMCGSKGKNLAVHDHCVVFYSTTPDASAGLEDDLRRFVPTLPHGVSFEVASDNQITH